MRFEHKRAEIYDIVLGKKATRPNEGKINMLKAFLTFGSKADSSVGRNCFVDRVEEIVLNDQRYQIDMIDGVFPIDIGQDPRKAPNPFLDQTQSQMFAKSTLGAAPA